MKRNRPTNFPWLSTCVAVVWLGSFVVAAQDRPQRDERPPRETPSTENPASESRPADRIRDGATEDTRPVGNDVRERTAAERPDQASTTAREATAARQGAPQRNDRPLFMGPPVPDHLRAQREREQPERPDPIDRADVSARMRERLNAFKNSRDAYLKVKAQQDMQEKARFASEESRERLRRQLRERHWEWMIRQREIRELLRDEIKDRFHNQRDRIIDNAQEERRRPGRD